MGDYQAILERSRRDPGGFWLEAAEAIDWHRPPATALDAGHAPFYRWFPDGELNTSYNALDQHVEAGRGEQAALVYDSPVTGSGRTYTYAELRDEVARCAGALAGLGVVKGDRVVVYMPMVPEAVIAVLACARLGAVHSVVFGGFAPKELAVRIDDSKPKVVVLRRAASSRTGSWNTSQSSMRRCAPPVTSRRAWWCCSASRPPRSSRPATATGWS
jgi:propionyl-CoA synthetase